ncbi:pentatricopeptide repeat-containing protein [Sesbania bispinosa]|nr:pentatricopeptide repeat-containing protein [Sesbania bispinosa]
MVNIIQLQLPLQPSFSLDFGGRRSPLSNSTPLLCGGASSLPLNLNSSAPSSLGRIAENCAEAANDENVISLTEHFVFDEFFLLLVF